MKLVRQAFLTTLAFISIAIAFSASAYAASAETILRVGYQPYDDLIDNIDHVGSEGYGYEVLKKIEEVSDFRFEFIEIKGDVFDALENGTVDLIGLYYLSEQRAEQYLYLETPFNSVQLSMVTKSDKPLLYGDPESIDGKTVATYAENPANELLDEFLFENNISVEYIMNELHNYRNVEADFYLVYSSDSNLSEFQTILNFGKKHTYMISNYGNEEMMSKLNEALHIIIAEESDFFETLGDKYNHDTYHNLHRDLTKQETEILRQRPLVVAYESSHRPLSFTNDDGEADGAIIDVVNELSAKYDFEVEFAPYSLSAGEGPPENCDVVVSAVGDNQDIMENYTSTISYYSMQMLAMVPRGLGIVGDVPVSENIRKSSPKIGITSYLHVNFDLFAKEAVENEFVFFNSFEDLLKAYANGEVDMAIFTESGTTYANSYLSDNENYTYAADFMLDFHYAISNDIADVYTPIFNVMLDNISKRQYDEILMRNTATHFYEPTFIDTIKDNWYYYAIALLMLVAAFISYVLYKQQQEQLKLTKAYNTDPQTGLMAIHKFRDELEEKIQKAKPNEYELISFDIDLFKTINTHYSALRGTEIIITIADCLKDIFKNSSAIITRRTADQFLILRRINQGGTMKELYTDHILPAIKEVIGQQYNLSMSFGNVVIGNVSTEKISAYIGKADDARVAGKCSHKTTFITFDEKMQKQYEDKINITFRMKKALKDREFFVEYQPKVNFNTLKIGGVEALVRWKPKLGETIYPDAFIPVFEKNGFIATLDLYVFDEVCRFIKNNHSFIDLPCISVNLSSHTILSEHLVSRISDIVSLHEIDPKMIELELTESAIETDPKMFLSRVKQLKKLGFNISIDDFGAGVSSLNRLSAIEADVLKLDKAFFNLEGQGGKSSVVVSDIVKMAKHLNMKVVAEGVETPAQAMWLKSIACDYAQGYYFEKPMPENKFVDLLVAKKQYSISLI